MNFNLNADSDSELKSELEEYDARIEAELEEKRQNTTAKHKKADKAFISFFWTVIVIGLVACFLSLL